MVIFPNVVVVHFLVVWLHGLEVRVEVCTTGDRIHKKTIKDT